MIKDNLDLLSGVRAIAIELHGTKNTIDRLLLPHGFTFEPLTKGYVLKQAIWQLLSHPITFLKIYNCLPNKSGKVEILKGNEHGLIVGMYYRNS